MLLQTAPLEPSNLISAGAGLPFRRSGLHGISVSFVTGRDRRVLFGYRGSIVIRPASPLTGSVLGFQLRLELAVGRLFEIELEPLAPFAPRITGARAFSLQAPS